MFRSVTLELIADQPAMHAASHGSNRRASEGFVTECGRKPSITWRGPTESWVRPIGLRSGCHSATLPETVGSLAILLRQSSISAESRSRTLATASSSSARTAHSFILGQGSNSESPSR